VLVGALEVEVAREAEPALAHDGVPRRARLEPHVEDVVHLLELAGGQLRSEAGGRPGIRGGVPAREQRQRLLARTEAAVRNTEPSGRRNAGIGKPQARWREMHQSGRDSSIPSSRFCPHSGTKRIRSWADSSASSRSARPSRASGRSTAMNHCSVQRKITGVFERQSWG
jgi:hypothetical protein